MDAHNNRLLAMLNSATSSPASKPPPGQVFASPPAPLLSPSSGTSQSPREPSPLPPPPSLNQVSFEDLFKNITMPSASVSQDINIGQPTAGNPTASVEKSSSIDPARPIAPLPSKDQHAKLLGMLGSLGTPPPKDTSSSSTLTPPGVGGLAGAPESHKANLLNLFKSSPPLASSTQEPVITHPQATTASVPDAPNTSSSPSPAQPPPFAKSPFHFVSPFDAFERSTSNAGSTTKRNASTTIDKSTGELEPAALPAATKDETFKVPPARINGTVVHMGHPEQSTEPVRKASGHLKAGLAELSRSSSVSSTQSIRAGALPLPIEKPEPTAVPAPTAAASGQGPMLLKSVTTIDLSEPNLDSLAGSPDASQIIPMTLMKNTPTFSRGRNVAMTTGWVAYALSKGRVRLIDRASGAKLVLEVGSAVSVVDIAATSTLVAVVASNSTVSVYKVPTSWNTDNPQVQNLVKTKPKKKQLGDVFRVDWIQRNGQEWLAVAGEKGVQLLPPYAWSAGQLGQDDAEPILTSEGPVVSFCVNHSNQAIGLLSATHSTLYNMSNLNRVWHRELPSSSPALAPSSVMFCESNLLVGRGEDTVFDLIQITTDIAVLSTIRFTGSPSSESGRNFGHAVYDASRSTLWVSQQGGASLWAFHYGIKGAPPVKDASSAKAGTVVGFDKVIQFPLEPVISFVIGPKSSSEDAEIFFSSPAGFSQAVIDKSALDAPGRAPTAKTITAAPQKQAAQPSPAAPAASVPSPKTPVLDSQVKPAATSTPAKKGVKATAKQVKLEPKSPEITNGTELLKADEISTLAATDTKTSGSSTGEDIAKLLAATESRIANNFKQNIKAQLGPLAAQLESVSSASTNSSTQLGKELQTSLISVIQHELKQSIVPGLNTAVQNSTRAVVPAAVKDAFSPVTKNLEYSINTAVASAMLNTVQPAIERSILNSLQQVVIPALDATTNRMAEQMLLELKSEMVQIRKDLDPPASDNGDLLQSMSATLLELQRQVTALSAQLARSQEVPRSAPFAAATTMTPNVSSSSTAVMTPQAATVYTSAASESSPPQSQPRLEDIFLSALTQGSPNATLQLIMDFWSMTENILPEGPGARSPLSQAVLLTLIHRTSVTAQELVPQDPNTLRAITWCRRAASLIDPTDIGIESYLPRVIAAAQTVLNNMLYGLTTRYANDSAAQAIVEPIRGLLDILNSKHH